MHEVARLKQQAARAAVQLVQSGMIVGLGHGSTTRFAVHSLADRLDRGEIEDIIAVAATEATASEARRLDIPLTSTDLDLVPDITIDGADEVDGKLNVIKGGGGALLYEKILAQASRQLVIIVDETKFSDVLGTRAPVPVEVVRFGLQAQLAFVTLQGAETFVRRDGDGSLFRTAEGNCIIDGKFGRIGDPYALAATLDSRAGIVAHGLFLDLAHGVIIATSDGIGNLQRRY